MSALIENLAFQCLYSTKYTFRIILSSISFNLAPFCSAAAAARRLMIRSNVLMRKHKHRQKKRMITARDVGRRITNNMSTDSS